MSERELSYTLSHSIHRDMGGIPTNGPVRSVAVFDIVQISYDGLLWVDYVTIRSKSEIQFFKNLVRRVHPHYRIVSANKVDLLCYENL